MALPSTMHTFRLDVADVDRGVYAEVELRVARHPSETVPYLLTRVLAYALELREGLAFGRGVSVAEDADLWAHDPTGRITLWVEIGSASADRLHKASKLGAEVAVYTHRDADALVAGLAGQRIHRAEALRVIGVPGDLLAGLEARLGRNNTWGVLRTEGVIYVSMGEDSATGALTLRTLAS